MGYNCSKNTISNYLTYLEKSYFIYPAYYYSKTFKDQMQYLRKIYFIDTGFLKFLSLNPDKTRFLENLIAIELRRRNSDLYYYRDKIGQEVDFVIVVHEEVKELIQVCYNLSMVDTRHREVSSLIHGMKHFKLKKGIIITYDEEETIKEKGYEIKVIPLWKWLLGLK